MSDLKATGIGIEVDKSSAEKDIEISLARNLLESIPSLKSDLVAIGKALYAHDKVSTQKISSTQSKRKIRSALSRN